MTWDARRQGLNVTAEVCTPYLFFTTDALDRLGPYAKCNPPCRSAETREELWRGIGAGLVEYLGTDHSPFTQQDKEQSSATTSTTRRRASPGSTSSCRCSSPACTSGR